MGYTKIHKKHFDRRKLTFEPLELENNINVAFTNYDISFKNYDISTTIFTINNSRYALSIMNDFFEARII